MMQVHSYTTTTPNVGRTFTIEQDCKNIIVRSRFNCAKTGDKPDSVAKVVAGFLKATGAGTISLTTDNGDSSRAFPICPSLQLGSVIEGYTSMRGIGRVEAGVVESVAAAGGVSAYDIVQLTFVIPIGATDTVRFSEARKLNVKLADFENVNVVTGVKADLELHFMVDASARLANDVVCVDVKSIPAGAITNFNLAGADVISFPSSASLVQLFGDGDTLLELDGSDEIWSFSCANARPIFFCNGYVFDAVNYVTVATPYHTRGAIKCADQSEVYFFSIKKLP